jgi:hypothetical protein
MALVSLTDAVPTQEKNVSFFSSVQNIMAQQMKKIKNPFSSGKFEFHIDPDCARSIYHLHTQRKAHSQLSLSHTKQTRLKRIEDSFFYIR